MWGTLRPLSNAGADVLHDDIKEGFNGENVHTQLMSDEKCRIRKIEKDKLLHGLSDVYFPLTKLLVGRATHRSV